MTPQTDHGHFSLSMGWLANPPMRCELIVTQLCDLGRLLLAGHSIPYYDDPQDILSDLHLVAMNEIRTLHGRIDQRDRDAEVGQRQARAAWGLVYGAGKRKTLRTEDLRNALIGEVS